MSYIEINNGDTGLTARNAINTNFSNIDDKNTKYDSLATYTEEETNPVISLDSWTDTLTSSTAFSGWGSQIGDIYDSFRYLGLKILSNDAGDLPTELRVIIREDDENGAILADKTVSISLVVSTVKDILIDFGEDITDLSGTMLWMGILTNGSLSPVGSGDSIDLNGWTKNVNSVYETDRGIVSPTWVSLGSLNPYSLYARLFTDYNVSSITPSTLLKEGIFGNLTEDNKRDLLLSNISINRVLSTLFPVVATEPTSGTPQFTSETSIFSGWGCTLGIVPTFKSVKIGVRSWDVSNPITNVNLKIREQTYDGNILVDETLPIANAVDDFLTFELSEPVTYENNIWLEFSTDGHSGWYGISGNEYDENTARYRTDESLTGTLSTLTTARTLYAEFIGESNAKLSDEAVNQVVEVANAVPDIYLNLPESIYSHIVYTTQIFYRGIIQDLDPYAYNIKITGTSGGKQYPRYYELNPVSADAGNKTLIFSIYDRDDRLVSQKTATVYISPVAPPASALNVLCLGDSLTSAGVWPTEFDRLMTGSGGDPSGKGYSNIEFIGTQGATGSTKYEGYGGKTWEWFVSNETSDIVITAVGHGKDDNDLQSIWEQSGNEYRLEQVDDANTLTFARVNHGNTPSSSGTLDYVSGAVNTSNITYTSLTSGALNPFWNHTTNELDIENYITTNNFGTVDCVVTLLSWNGQGPNRSTPADHADAIADAKTWIDNLHASYPNCKVKLMGLPLPSLNGGLGTNYGDATSGYGNYFGLVKTVFGLNKAYKELSEEVGYSDFVEFIDVATQFDNENNMPEEDTPVNTRNSKTEERGTNGVHPADSGYYQIADVAFRAFANEYL